LNYTHPIISATASLGDLLIERGLEKYVPMFEKEEIDRAALMDLREDHLRAMGISATGPLVKIQKLQQDLRESQLHA